MICVNIVSDIKTDLSLWSADRDEDNETQVGGDKEALSGAEPTIERDASCQRASRKNKVKAKG